MKWWKIAIFLAGIFSLTVAIIARNLNAEKYRAFICKDVEFLSFDVDGSTDWIQFNLGYNYYMFSPSIGIKFYNDDYNLDKEVLKRMKILIKYGDSEMVCINGDELNGELLGMRNILQIFIPILRTILSMLTRKSLECIFLF